MQQALNCNTEYVGKTEILYFLNTDIIGRKTVQKADLRPSVVFKNKNLDSNRLPNGLRYILKIYPKLS